MIARAYAEGRGVCGSGEAHTEAHTGRKHAVRIGAHLPTGDGLARTCVLAVESGCECLQVFAKSPRLWKGAARDPDEAAEFRAECARLDLRPVVTHAAYLINLGSSDPLLWERSWRALADELERAALLGASAVIVHAGTRYDGVGTSPVGRVADAVARAWDHAAPIVAGPVVALENSAGAGRSFGSSMEELCEAASLARASGARVAVCFDSCHGFAAGIDVSGPEGWSAVCDAVESSLGLGGLVAVHANDCKGGLGEHRDRHEWIGDGEMGRAGFAAMLREPRLSGVAAIVEMPGDPEVKDRENVGRLRKLRDAFAGDDAPVPGTA
jgi:deoxyribonuclease-4